MTPKPGESKNKMTPSSEALDRGKEELGVFPSLADFAALTAEDVAEPVDTETLIAEYKRAFSSGSKEEVSAESINAARDLLASVEVHEEDKDPLLNPEMILSRSDYLHEQRGKIDSLSEEEKKEFVLDARKKITGLRFLIWYAKTNGELEEKDGKVLWQTEKGEVDLDELEKDLLYFEEKVSSIKMMEEASSDGNEANEADGKEKEESLYENLDRLRDNISVTEFLKLSLEQRLNLISNISSKDLLKRGTLLVFDFGANHSLEQQIGLGDLMPPWVREMSIGGVSYKRRGNQGFYNKGKYLAIFTGSQVKVSSFDVNYSAEAHYEKKYDASYKKSDLVRSAGGIESKVERTEVSYLEIAEVAEDFMVDAFFLQAVLEEKQYDPAISTGANYDFLHMAARYVQNAEAKYEELFGSALNENGKYYSEKFIAYAMDRFNLFNSFNPEQEAVVGRVLTRYGELRGVELDMNKLSESKKELNPNSNSEYQRRVREKGFSESVDFEMPHGGKGIDILENEDAWEQGLRESLRQKGVPEKQIDMTVFYSRAVYQNMRSRMGSMYEGKVSIRSYNGKLWTIKNSCVGGSMSFSAGLPLRIMRGSQAGKKFASNYYWGGHKQEERIMPGGFHYIRSMIGNDSLMQAEHGLTPGNVDERVGRHLQVGEPAVAGLWNHALWLYKRPDGTVMMVHSGADVRPKRILASQVGEAPSGYSLRGKYYVRNRGSKVNEVPFREYLAKKKSKYSGGRAFVKFVPMSTLVQENLNYVSGSSDFEGFYEENQSNA